MPDSIVIHPFEPILDGKETYTYDALDRLTVVVGNQGMTINYGAGGNILSKSSVGNYSYDADEQPHAVKGVTNSAGKISSLMLETVYGELNRIEMMTQGTRQTSFTYGPDMQRWRTMTEQDGATERTVLYDPLLGRFLSPDNYVQQPDNSQSFNRYSYCLNNPLKVTTQLCTMTGRLTWINKCVK